MIGFVTWFLLSLLWWVGLRSSGGVKVVDRIEENLNEIRKHPIRRLVPGYALTMASIFACLYLFNMMYYSSIMIMMWTVVAMYSGFFVGRFFLFHFWEDLLFAASVALAWGLYLLQARQLASLAIVPPLAVIVGTVCLHHRWRNWVRSLPASEAEPASPEGCS
jgi:uncharacterized membrane protein YjjP (DUF1212 family)